MENLRQKFVQSSLYYQLISVPSRWYCVAGTIGHRLMSGKPTKIDLDENTQIDVRCQIHQLSFSPHTDAKGIMDLLKFLSPKHVILVHGEKPKMALLKGRIQSELGIQCHDPANNDTVCIPSTHYIKADTSNAFVRSSLSPNFKFLKRSIGNSDLGPADTSATSTLQVCDERVAEGILIMERNQMAKVVHEDELPELLGEKTHVVQFAHCCPVTINNLERTTNSDLSSSKDVSCVWLHLLFAKLSNELTEETIQDCGEHLQVESMYITVWSKDNCPYRTTDCFGGKSATTYFCCTWSVADEKLAWKIISIMKNLDLSNT
ncbi:Cleavage and polyadenylation specificity factor subunit 3-II [Camellia lanceoleosa]|uniref:Cleavage and polyadenylation specificity factor subunit 3-II n=1 Tax=Camellia lanceoleosa TaxID=1840588 RepID=A0ACC0G4W1_9ERIC|nr:Cleavage and polyadenylation specificity factor subunit 3-II [Camellia lanceoleosa]